jgi:hypothetical protein
MKNLAELFVAVKKGYAVIVICSAALIKPNFERKGPCKPNE